MSKTNGTSADSSQWICLLPDQSLTYEKGEKYPSLVKLKHPKSGQPAMFMFNHDSTEVYEMLQFKEEFRSWFIGELVQRDGSLYVSTIMDPVFLILPFLMKESKVVPLEQLLTDSEYPELHRLCSCTGTKHLSAVADVKGDEEFKAYKFNKDKTLLWLQKKVQQLSAAIIKAEMDVSGGAQALIYKQSKTANTDDATRYAFGMVSDYISVELAKELKEHMKIVDPEIEREKPVLEAPNAKKAKSNVVPTEDYSQNGKAVKKKEVKLTAAQKKLSSVDKSGMKSMMSFFAKK